jgi:hypothetical protein
MKKKSQMSLVPLLCLWLPVLASRKRLNSREEGLKEKKEKERRREGRKKGKKKGNRTKRCTKTLFRGPFLSQGGPVLLYLEKRRKEKRKEQKRK